MDSGFFSMYAGFLPEILFWVAAIVVAAILWRRSPAAGILIFIGAAASLLTNIAQPFLDRHLFDGDGVESIVVHSYYFAMSLIRAGGMSLLLIAAYIGRAAPAAPYPQAYAPPMPSLPMPNVPAPNSHHPSLSPIPTLAPASNPAADNQGIIMVEESHGK